MSLKNQPVMAVNPDHLQNIVVVAGAGAGKTYTLVHEYLFTLLGSCVVRDPKRILAVTFTEKAAQEMRARVCAGLQMENAEARELMIYKLSQASICTFHSFAAQTLRKYSSQAGIDPNFSLLDPNDEQNILREIGESAVLQALENGEFDVGKLVARFKVRGLVDNLINLYNGLLEHGLGSDELALVSVDEDIRARCIEVHEYLTAFENESARASVTTKNRLLAVRSAYGQLALTLNEQIDDVEIRLAHCFKKLRTSVKGRFGSDALRKPLVMSIVSLGSAICNSVTAKDAQVIAGLVSRIGRDVRDHKDKFGVLGFGDLIYRLRLLLRNDLAVRKSVKSSFDRILVDEFQDTSPAQEDLVALLAENVADETVLLGNQRAMGMLALEPGKLFVVGDPKQSIYGFRGADAKLFAHTLEVVTKGSAIVGKTGVRKTLGVCRRSQRDIVDFVNVVAKHTLSLSADGVPFEQEDALSSIRPATGRAGEIWQALKLEDEDSQEAMAQALAKKVSELMVDCRASDIAVLVRRIKSAAPIVQNLFKLGINAQIFGGDGFYSCLEIVDIAAALKLVVDPHHQLATMILLRSPLIALSDTEIIGLVEGIENWSGGLSWAQVSTTSKIPEVVRFEEIRRNLKQNLPLMSLSQAIDQIVDGCDYLLAISVEHKAPEKLANLRKLRGMYGELGDSFLAIERLWRNCEKPPRESIAHVTEGAMDAVRIMTIHQSKGLEFPIVIVADTLSASPNDRDDIVFDPELGLALNHKARPISACSPETTDEKAFAPTAVDRVRRRKKSRVEAELARQLYVALTRARDRLYFMDVFCDTKPLVSRGLSLRKLLFMAQERDPEVFARLMPTVRVDKTAGIVAVRDSVSIPLEFYSPVDQSASHSSRILASKSKFPSPLNPLPQGASEITSSKRGSLAHLLISRAFELLDVEKLRDQEATISVLKAIARSSGLYQFIDDELFVRCSRTLSGPIIDLVSKGANLSFEEAIVYEDDDNNIVEGIADLVVRNGKETIVIDFKSSQQSTFSKQTINQLNLYARGLAKNEENIVYISPVCIGDPKPIVYFLPRTAAPLSKSRVVPSPLEG